MLAPAMIFPVSGVEVNILIPPLVALAISFFASLGGLSGAFLIMPFMVSGLGYTGPSASATNFAFNIAAIPSGVYRFTRDRRVLWPLVKVFILGTIPGLGLGYALRIKVITDPTRFKIFVGIVLMYMAIKLFIELINRKAKKTARAGIIHKVQSTSREISFSMNQEKYAFRTLPLFTLSLGVGVVGGAYGIGGGALIVPYLVSVAGLPIYAVAGAALLGTFITSVAGVLVYEFVPSAAGVATSPDWALGLLFGLGGAVGIYLGARAQPHVPERMIKWILFISIFGIALKYISEIWR